MFLEEEALPLIPGVILPIEIALLTPGVILPAEKALLTAGVFLPVVGEPPSGGECLSMEVAVLLCTGGLLPTGVIIFEVAEVFIICTGEGPTRDLPLRVRISLRL